jgi:hypothetical protein
VAKVPSTSASIDIPYTSQNIKAQRKGGLDQKPLETNAKSNGMPLIIDCKQFSWTSRIKMDHWVLSNMCKKNKKY